MTTTTNIVNLPLTTRLNNGFFKTAVRPVPANFAAFVVTMTPTTGNPATPFQGIAHPFNDPTITVEWGIMYSWDGGVTFPDIVSRVEQGNAQGQWIAAKGTTMQPVDEFDLVWDSAAAGIPPATDPSNLDPRGYPTSYVGFVRVTNGPVNSGVRIDEVTTV